MHLHAVQSVCSVPLRFTLWAAIVFLVVLLITSGQYWLGHLFEDDIDTIILQTANDTFVTNTSDERQPQEFIEVSEILPNCGIQEECPEDTFAVHVYTGQDKDDQPKLCVRGKYIIGGNINGGGRGLNAAIVDSVHFQVVAVQNFDLYSQNSTSLELWLTNQVRENDIIIAFTFDEASKELSRKAKTSLYKLGSGKIQDLQFRSQWYMISQKGINGFTSLEKLTFAKNDRWGDVIDERLCVPRKIPPITVTPDPEPRRNALREHLCDSTPVLQCLDFCAATSRREPVYPALLTNRSLIGNDAYSTPIIVVAGKSISSLILTSESLIHQPGVHAPSVIVVHTQEQELVPELARIFSFQSLLVNSTANNDHILYSLRYVRNKFPNKKYVIVLEENLILSPDFLFYMAQLVPTLEKDESLLGVSAWNPNGYTNVSSNLYIAYRSEHFPGLGFLMPVRVFDKYLENNFSSCCSEKPILGWDSVIKESGGNIVIPDVSRVLLRPIGMLQNVEQQLFTQPRATNIDNSVWIDHPQDLVKDRYFQQMAVLMQESTTFHLSAADMKLCEEGRNTAITVMLKELRRRVLAVYYQEKLCNSYNTVRTLAKCFGIFIPKDFRPQGMYQNVLRFTVMENTVFLIESSSPFYKPKQKQHLVI